MNKFRFKCLVIGGQNEHFVSEQGIGRKFIGNALCLKTDLDISGDLLPYFDD